MINIYYKSKNYKFTNRVSYYALNEIYDLSREIAEKDATEISTSKLSIYHQSLSNMEKFLPTNKKYDKRFYQEILSYYNFINLNVGYSDVEPDEAKIKDYRENFKKIAVYYESLENNKNYFDNYSKMLDFINSDYER